MTDTTKCDACGMVLAWADSKTDSDGFTGCRPCFPVSNRDEDKDRLMRGPCRGKHTSLAMLFEGQHASRFGDRRGE